MLQRQDIEGQDAVSVGETLSATYKEHC